MLSGWPGAAAAEPHHGHADEPRVHGVEDAVFLREDVPAHRRAGKVVIRPRQEVGGPALGPHHGGEALGGAPGAQGVGDAAGAVGRVLGEVAERQGLPA